MGVWPLSASSVTAGFLSDFLFKQWLILRARPWVLGVIVAWEVRASLQAARSRCADEAAAPKYPLDSERVN